MLPEIQTYVEFLREAREQVTQVLDGMTAEGLNWHPLPDETNSLYVLAVHCLGAERGWLHELVGQRPIERDRAAEFHARGEEAGALRGAFDTTMRTSDEILARLIESDMGAMRGKNASHMHSVRWCILHVVEHYSEHLGQMRLTRQLWENRTTRPHEI